MNIIKYLISPKYRLFRRKVDDVQMAMWELEFKIGKARHIREGVRVDRDRVLELMHLAKEALAKPDLDAEKRKEQETLMAQYEEAKKKYEGQLKMIDDQIVGVPADGDNPGQQGLNDTMKAYAELREMYRDHLKRV